MAIREGMGRKAFQVYWLYCHSITILDKSIYTKYIMATKSPCRALAYPVLNDNLTNNSLFGLQAIDFKAKNHCHFAK